MNIHLCLFCKFLFTRKKKIKNGGHFILPLSKMCCLKCRFQAAYMNVLRTGSKTTLRLIMNYVATTSEKKILMLLLPLLPTITDNNNTNHNNNLFF